MLLRNSGLSTYQPTSALSTTAKKFTSRSGGLASGLSGIERLRENPAITLGAANSFREHCAAFHLVYQEYVKCGYMKPQHSQMRYSALNFLPCAVTMVARAEGRIIATGSTVFTEQGELPSSGIFGTEFQALARQGRRVAEGTMLACTDFGEVRAHRIARHIIKLGVCWSAAHGIDDWCVVVNPKHVPFWHGKFGLEILGEQKPCPHVEALPGVLLRLDIHKLLEGALPVTRDFAEAILDGWTPAANFNRPHRFTEEEVCILLMKQPQLVAALTPAHRALLRSTYPHALRMAEKSLEAEAFHGTL